MFVNAVLGIVSRVAPQMNAFAIGFPLTLSAGLLGLAVTLPMLEQPTHQAAELDTRHFCRTLKNQPMMDGVGGELCVV
jgi:flagellar biosynthetic protein FliR